MVYAQKERNEEELNKRNIETHRQRQILWLQLTIY